MKLNPGGKIQIKHHAQNSFGIIAWITSVFFVNINKNVT